MGSGIATTLILSNIVVFLKEINTEHLQKGVKAIEVIEELRKKFVQAMNNNDVKAII